MDDIRPILTLTYRPAPESQAVQIELADDRWDDLHDRLVARGMCAAWDQEMGREWRALLKRDEDRRENARKRP